MAQKAGIHHGNKLHVKKGDKVIVLSGKHKGQTGKVLRALPKEAKVLVEGINVLVKNVKPQRQLGQTEGSREKREVALHASKVALVDPETGKATRVRANVVDGKKVRVAVKSGKNID